MGCIGAGHRRCERKHKRANMSWCQRGIGLSRKRLWPAVALFRLYNLYCMQFARTCKFFFIQFLKKEIPPLYGEEQREIQKERMRKIERCLIHAAVWLRTKTMAMSLRSDIANRYERLEDIGIYSAPVYKAVIDSTVESLTVIFYYALYHIL